MIFQSAKIARVIHLGNFLLFFGIILIFLALHPPQCLDQSNSSPNADSKRIPLVYDYQISCLSIFFNLFF